MEKVKIFINGKQYEVEKNLTVMKAADEVGFHIPRLCYHSSLSIEGACRVCIVEVEGQKNFVASCAFPVFEGMKINTNTYELRQARRDIVELLLDNHPEDCHTCERDSNCELQRLANMMGIKHRHFTGKKKSWKMDFSSSSIVRNPDKCVLCGRCVRLCSEIQKVNAIRYANRGFNTVVMPAFNMPFKDSVCINCGQCVNVCPTAALTEKNYTQELFKYLDDKSLHKVVQIAPAVRAAIGEEFGFPVGTNVEKKVVAALRKLGFDAVFDTQFSADLTIMEEASEFLERLQNDLPLPLITSCSPGWVKYVESFYPEFIPNLSSCKSPMSMLGGLLKTYYPKKMKMKPENILSVAVMPCTAKKYEASREELSQDGYRDTDIVITTRELAWMIKSAGIDFQNIEGESFDEPLSMSSGAGTIFGVTGGVMEAALRTVYELALGETLVEIEFKSIRNFEGIKEAEVEIEGKIIRVAVAHGLGNAHTLMEIVKENPMKYQFIEIMACPGGCIGGGGQPYVGENFEPLSKDLLEKRAMALYDSDRNNTIRRSHENPHVQRIYKEYLGRPLSKKSHKILHTEYSKLNPCGIIPEEILPR